MQEILPGKSTCLTYLLASQICLPDTKNKPNGVLAPLGPHAKHGGAAYLLYLRRLSLNGRPKYYVNSLKVARALDEVPGESLLQAQHAWVKDSPAMVIDGFSATATDIACASKGRGLIKLWRES
ncbi:unnamed protein product [Meganyctiphanes norvegica]|uniref:Uncharacterized protein n=1 Tax=Meganyctiphanes norvegica TaxID=48144 RepID=A0AAV2QB32_MEGNR